MHTWHVVHIGPRDGFPKKVQVTPVSRRALTAEDHAERQGSEAREIVLDFFQDGFYGFLCNVL